MRRVSLHSPAAARMALGRYLKAGAKVVVTCILVITQNPRRFQHPGSVGFTALRSHRVCVELAII